MRNFKSTISNFIISVGLLLSLPAFAENHAVFNHPVSDENLSELHQKIRGRLGGSEVLRAEFNQSKKIKALKRPLISQGQFIFARNTGVGWIVKKPFPSTFIMKPDALIQEDAKGKRQTIPVDKHPWTRMISDAFLSMFSGSADDMTKHFFIYYHEAETAWSIGLKPRDERLKQVFNALILSGADEDLQQIIMDETSGDATTINFSNLQTEPGKLTAKELQLFNGKP
jgi:outer membrane lipoprotein-sorting protein